MNWEQEKQELITFLTESRHPLAPGEPLIEKLRNIVGANASMAQIIRENRNYKELLIEALKRLRDGAEEFKGSFWSKEVEMFLAGREIKQAAPASDAC